jgi:heme exporter protein D
LINYFSLPSNNTRHPKQVLSLNSTPRSSLILSIVKFAGLFFSLVDWPEMQKKHALKTMRQRDKREKREENSRQRSAVQSIEERRTTWSVPMVESVFVTVEASHLQEKTNMADCRKSEPMDR